MEALNASINANSTFRKTPSAFASFDLETMMPLSPPPVMTQTGLPCNFGSLTRSQDTKKQSQSIKAIIRCIRTRVEHLTQKVNVYTGIYTEK